MTGMREVSAGSLLAAAQRGRDQAARVLAVTVEDVDRFPSGREARLRDRRLVFTAARVEWDGLLREADELGDVVWRMQRSRMLRDAFAATPNGSASAARRARRRRLSGAVS